MRYYKKRDILTDEGKIMLQGNEATREQIIDLLQVGLESIDWTVKTQQSNSVPLLTLYSENGESKYILWANGIFFHKIYYSVVDAFAYDSEIQIRPENYRDVEYVFDEMIELLNLSY